jgi:hypothetical protein
MLGHLFSAVDLSQRVLIRGRSWRDRMGYSEQIDRFLGLIDFGFDCRTLGGPTFCPFQFG